MVIRTDIFGKLSLDAPGFWAVFDTKLKQFVFKYVMLMTSRFSWAAKGLFTFTKLIFERRKYISSAFIFTERFARFTL